MKVYNGVLMRGDEKLSFIIRANNPDEVVDTIVEWPSMKNYEVRFVRISTDLDKTWTEQDISMVLSGETDGIWARCTT